VPPAYQLPRFRLPSRMLVTACVLPVRQVDANGDARIGFDEFVRVMAPLLQDAPTVGRLSSVLAEDVRGAGPRQAPVHLRSHSLPSEGVAFVQAHAVTITYLEPCTEAPAACCHQQELLLPVLLRAQTAA